MLRAAHETRDLLVREPTIDPPEQSKAQRAATGPSAPAGKRSETKQEPKEFAVELRNVTNKYKGVTALADVSLQVKEGEFFSLLGPSGCGKTTTLNIIGGFVHPHVGDVLIQGQSVVGTPPYRRPVNTVFQSYALFPHMSVFDNVGFGLRMARLARPQIGLRVHEALRLVSLSGFEERRPSQLSGGQQQRVALARALVNRPAVLLLDEPLGALDLKLRKQMQLELGRIQREVGITFVYVTHDQEEAMTMSDRIAIMNKGSVIQVGTPQRVYSFPASLFVADFIGASNVLMGEILEVNTDIAVVRLASGDVIRARAPTGLGIGDDIAVVVRPDQLTLSHGPSRASNVNGISGRVIKVAFLGTHLHISVQVGASVEIGVRLGIAPTEGMLEPPQPGDTVYLTWDFSRSLSFPKG